MKRTDTATKRRGRKRRRPEPTGPESGTVYVEAIGRSVYVFDTMHRPLVSELVAEDFCWRSAVAVWRARRPGWWQLSQRRAWKHEGEPLDAKRDRIREFAAELGIAGKA